MAPQRLPVSATPLVGRARELVLLRQLLLDGDVRAVTITGPAGVGKTPLAMALFRCVDPGQAEGQPVGYGYCGMASELQICRLARVSCGPSSAPYGRRGVRKSGRCL